MIKLIKTPEEHAEYSVEIKIHNDTDLSEMCRIFEYFLLACGYVFDGNIEIVESEGKHE